MLGLRVSMAEEFVSCRIQPRKVVVFIKPSCPYCRRTDPRAPQPIALQTRAFGICRYHSHQ
uniref:Glutaredoxin domain-containing protein n=1 Tax=Suricata suricatta TaxID=37032 RepID=A0A673SXQ2_SURSU